MVLMGVTIILAVPWARLMAVSPILWLLLTCIQIYWVCRCQKLLLVLIVWLTMMLLQLVKVSRFLDVLHIVRTSHWIENSLPIALKSRVSDLLLILMRSLRQWRQHQILIILFLMSDFRDYLIWASDGRLSTMNLLFNHVLTDSDVALGLS